MRRVVEEANGEWVCGASTISAIRQFYKFILPDAISVITDNSGNRCGMITTAAIQRSRVCYTEMFPDLWFNTIFLLKTFHVLQEAGSRRQEAGQIILLPT